MAKKRKRASYGFLNRYDRYLEDFNEYLPAFVYGTLREGFGNWRAHLQGNVDRMQPATVKGTIHAVRGISGFPCLFDTDGAVHGELMYIQPDKYVEVMNGLDGLEGNGFMYQRKKVTVTADDGTEILAWAYYWLGKRENVGWLIRSGDWKEHTLTMLRS